MPRTAHWLYLLLTGCAAAPAVVPEAPDDGRGSASAASGAAATPRERYVAHLHATGVAHADADVQEVPGYAIGEMKFFRLSSPGLGPGQGRPVGVTREVVAGADQWDGWRYMMSHAQGAAELARPVALLRGDLVVVDPASPGLPPEATAVIRPPTLESRADGGFTYVIWLGNPASSEPPGRYTITVPPAGDGTVEFARWDEVAMPDPCLRALNGWKRASDPLGKKAVAMQIVERCDDRGNPVLIEALDETYDDLRIVAAHGLAARKAEAAVPALTRAADAEEPSVRAAAVEALAAVGTPAARDVVERVAIKDPEQWVREHARLLVKW